MPPFLPILRPRRARPAPTGRARAFAVRPGRCAAACLFAAIAAASAGEAAVQTLARGDADNRLRLAALIDEAVEMTLPLPEPEKDLKSLPDPVARRYRAGTYAARLSPILHLVADERRHRRALAECAGGRVARVRGKLVAYPGPRAPDGQRLNAYYLDIAALEPAFDPAALASPGRDEAVEDAAPDAVLRDPAAWNGRAVRMTTRFPGVTDAVPEVLRGLMGLDETAWRTFADSPFWPRALPVVLRTEAVDGLKALAPWRDAVRVTGRLVAVDGEANGPRATLLAWAVAPDPDAAWLVDPQAVARAEYAPVDPSRAASHTLAGRRVRFPFPWRGWAGKPEGPFVGPLSRLFPAGRDAAPVHFATKGTDWAGRGALAAARPDAPWRAVVDAAASGDTLWVAARIEGLPNRRALAVVEDVSREPPAFPPPPAPEDATP